MSAAAESIAFGFSDRVVISAMSTLGQVSMAIHNKASYYLAGWGTHSDGHQCWSTGATISDPCLYYGDRQFYEDMGYSLDLMGLQRCTDQYELGVSVKIV